MLTLLPKGAQTKLLKFFCLKIFSICHRCRWCTLSREYLREFSKKFEMTVLLYSDACGKLIHEKNQKSKISWHCPFKRNSIFAESQTKLIPLCLRVRGIKFDALAIVERDSVTRFSTSGFFHQSVSPKHMSIPVRPFRIFSKIRGDIRSSRLTTGVADTGSKWENLQSENLLWFLLDTFG